MKRDDKTRAAAVSSGPIYGGDFDFDTIRMIALDLDGTTLTRNGLTRRTKETLEEAIRRGIHVVIATGRVYASLPEAVKNIQGLQYIITSNGAHISDAATGEILYSDCMEPEAVDLVSEILPQEPYPVEVFTGGKAYIARNIYEDLAQNGSDFMSAKYVLRTRTPVDDIYALMREHREAIENINVHFAAQEARMAMWERFAKLPHMTGDVLYAPQYRNRRRDDQQSCSTGRGLRQTGAGIAARDGVRRQPQRFDDAAGMRVQCGDGQRDTGHQSCRGLCDNHQ